MKIPLTKVVSVFVLIIFGLVLYSMDFEVQEPYVPTNFVQNHGPVLIEGGHRLNLEVVDTERERTRGLSGRESLGKNAGMLFVFPVSNTYGFWMKDMNFSIDIVWLDENFEIVYIKEEVSPETYPESFRPDTPARYVLEVNAGVMNEMGKNRIGQTLNIENIVR